MITKEFILIVIAILLGIYIGSITFPNDKQLIDCSIAEISPDYTNEMKEACRKERMTR